MKKIINVLFFMSMIFVFSSTVKALDTRIALTRIEADSNVNDLATYGHVLENASFTVTTPEQVQFITEDSGGWYRYNGERWLHIINGYNIYSGSWHYRVKVRIDGESGSMFRLTSSTKIIINGEEWYFSYSSSESGTDYSVGWATSPSYVVEPSGELSFFSLETYRVYINYINTAIYSFSVSSTAEGGTEPYIFSKTSGPEWINVSSDGTISGTPTEVGENEDLVVRVTDAEDNFKEITVPVDKTILTPALREEIENINATSNTSSIPVLGGEIKHPTFTIEDPKGETFAEYAAAWYKKVGNNWVEKTGEFTAGLWQYRTRIILQGEPAEIYKFTDNTTVFIDGVDWNAGLSGVGNEYYELSISSPEYMIKDKVNSIELYGDIQKPIVGNDIINPSIGILSINGDNELINIADVEAVWQYKTGEGFFDWANATGKFEAGKKYHVRFLITVNSDIYDLANIATFPVTYGNYELTQFQLNDKTVGEFIEFGQTIEQVTTPSVKITNNNNIITLTWDVQSAATKYIVYESTDGKKYNKSYNVTTNKFTRSGLTFNKAYYYKVRSCDATKCSGYSNVAWKKIVPNKVNLKLKSVGTNNIKIGWDKVGTTGYEVQRSTNNKKWTKVKTVTKNSTLEFNNKKLKNVVTYYYRVRAYKKVGSKKVYGAWSNVIVTKTAPLKPKAAIVVNDYNSLKLWFGPVKGTARFELQESFDGKTYSTIEGIVKNGTYYRNDLEFNKTYYYRVRACNNYNVCGAWTYFSKKQTTKVPSLALSTTSKIVKVTFTKVNEADGYEIIRSIYKNKKYTLIKTVLTAEDMPLSFNNATKKGTTYYYKIRSFKVVDGKKVYSDYSGYKKIKSK